MNASKAASNKIVVATKKTPRDPKNKAKKNAILPYDDGTPSSSNTPKAAAASEPAVSPQLTPEPKSRASSAPPTPSLIAGEESSNIQVIVRVRPFNKREQSLNSKLCTTINEGGANEQSITLYRDQQARNKEKKFFFDHVFGMDSTQQQVYEQTGRRILERFLMGYNCCSFAYGQTGSGKTFTLEGTKDEPGVMTRFAKDLFLLINERKDEWEYAVRCSYIEIYQEKIQDLLDQNPSFNISTLKIREDKVKGIYVTNLTELPVDCEDDILDILQRGSKNRTVGETKMNETSSRSHAVMTLYLESKQVNDEDGFTTKSSKVHIVDLAGSERASSTEAKGTRLKEGAKINQSLSSLGNVINALVKNSQERAGGGNNFVPYRDSKLTFLLKDSLGGNSVTQVIVALSPADVNVEESLSTLYFADRAKQIRNRIMVNREPHLQKIAELMEENEKLKKRIAALEGALSRHGISDEESRIHATKYHSEKGIQCDDEMSDSKTKCCKCSIM
jgi:kinesin family protein 3/17